MRGESISLRKFKSILEWNYLFRYSLILIPFSVFCSILVKSIFWLSWLNSDNCKSITLYLKSSYYIYIIIYIIKYLSILNALGNYKPLNVLLWTSLAQIHLLLKGYYSICTFNWPTLYIHQTFWISHLYLYPPLKLDCCWHFHLIIIIIIIIIIISPILSIFTILVTLILFLYHYKQVILPRKVTKI